MNNKKHLLLIGLCAVTQYAIADQITINNNNQQPPEPTQSACGAPAPSDGGLRPGTYTRQNSNGSSDTIYTTGDKQPYIVDNNCNNGNMASPIISPNVFPGPYKNGGGNGGGGRR